MTIAELIECLEDYRTELGDDAEVRLMTQQNYPFENAVSGLASGEEINDYEDEDLRDDDVENDGVLYIVEGQQICYGSRKAWAVCE